MRIAMFTNTFTPHVGGVARSVERFAESLRSAGDEVLIVAPEYGDATESGDDIERVPAMQNFNGSDFSFPLPLKPRLRQRLDAFAPDLLHAHHPYLLGDTALRVAAERDLPLVFTHHTQYEHYTHYTPLDSEAIRTFIIHLSTGYANQCDAVIAPSESIAEILRGRSVERTVTVIPTGVQLSRFADGSGSRFRKRHDLPADGPVIGHVGRLAEEKNLLFLAESVAQAMNESPEAYFVVVGDGPMRDRMQAALSDNGLGERVLFTGTLLGPDLVDAYHAMNVFAFSSTTETQGMVLVEALSAGCPVVALDAPGSREVIRDETNGLCVAQQKASTFAQAVLRVLRTPGLGDSDACVQSAEPFSMKRSTERLRGLYQQVIAEGHGQPPAMEVDFESLRRALNAEWELWANRAEALAGAALETRSENE